MLNKILYRIFLVIILASCSVKTDNWQWIDTLPKPWLLSESEVTEILPEFYKRFPIFEERLKAIVIWRIGTPYEIFKLGEETLPDTDPIIRLDVSDCTAHVLTSLSFAQSESWDEARENIVKIHYKYGENGKQVPTYQSRWHFTSNRILSNPNTVNIANELIDSTGLETIDLTLNIKDDDSKLLDLDWSKKIELSYFSNNNINISLLEKLPDICGIAFVRKSYFENGLAIAHEGILIDQRELIHASSKENETVKVGFLNYYFNDEKPRFDGIMIYKFVPLK